MISAPRAVERKTEEEMVRTAFRMVLATGAFCFLASQVPGQSNVGLAEHPNMAADIPAVTGHEAAASKALIGLLSDLHPKTDNLGNVYATIGSGTPHRLIAVVIDQLGYVVSEITFNGYLRVQRLPQAAPNAVFDSLNFAQPMVVFAASGKQVPGVFAGLSVHLQPGRPNPPKMNQVEELYVDIGATNEAEVRAAGVDLLDPIALRQRSMTVGDGEIAGPGAVEHIAGDAA